MRERVDKAADADEVAVEAVAVVAVVEVEDVIEDVVDEVVVEEVVGDVCSSEGLMVTYWVDIRGRCSSKDESISSTSSSFASDVSILGGGSAVYVCICVSVTTEVPGS